MKTVVSPSSVSSPSNEREGDGEGLGDRGGGDNGDGGVGDGGGVMNDDNVAALRETTAVLVRAVGSFRCFFRDYMVR